MNSRTQNTLWVVYDNTRKLGVSYITQIPECFLPRSGWVGSALGVGTVGLAFTFLFSACDSLLGDDDDATSGLSANTTVSDSEGNVYEVGYDQVSSNDQQPFVRKHNAAGTQLWYHRHDTTDADMKAVAVALDAHSRPYVLFSVDGGRTDAQRIQVRHVEDGAFSGVPFTSYGPGCCR